MISNIQLDLRIGGFGDIWMRLCGLYSAAALRPDLHIVCIVPTPLRELARKVFGDRIEQRDAPSNEALVFTNLGLRHLLPLALQGRRFVVPYHRRVVADWGKSSIKDFVNTSAFSLFNFFGYTQLPPWSSIDRYQGYFETISIARLRDITWEEFLSQARIDYPTICQRVRDSCTELCTHNFEIGTHEVAVFPSGTAHQNMPVDWAKQYLGHAKFCFHESDSTQNSYRQQGLHVLTFSHPCDIVVIAQKAKTAISTDSFPSHLLQYSIEQAVLVLTEAPRERIVSPFFAGTVVESAAECTPCPHLERGQFRLCKAGYETCLTWRSERTVNKVTAVS